MGDDCGILDYRVSDDDDVYQRGDDVREELWEGEE